MKKLLFCVLNGASLLLGILMIILALRDNGAGDNRVLILCATLFILVPLGMILGGLVASGKIGMDKTRFVDIAVGGILLLVGAVMIWMFGKELGIFKLIPGLFVLLGGVKIVNTLRSGHQEEE